MIRYSYITDYQFRFHFNLLISGFIKYVSLAILTIQNAALGLSMRYARTRDVEMFSSTAGYRPSSCLFRKTRKITSYSYKQ